MVTISALKIISEKKKQKRIQSAVSSISLAELCCEWIMNILGDVRGLEDEGYLQLNSDKSTDTWAPKLPQQCMARWYGWSSFNPGWASAMFRRGGHKHCVRLLGDFWYSYEVCLRELLCNVSKGISQDVWLISTISSVCKFYKHNFCCNYY
jgi:hypothetical protein